MRGRLAGVPAAHDAFYARMAAAVLGEGPVPATPAEARDTVEVIELALASAAEGRVIRVSAQTG